MAETAHLLASPANAERLKRSIEQMEALPASSSCPICGQDFPHNRLDPVHAAAEAKRSAE